MKIIKYIIFGLIIGVLLNSEFVYAAATNRPFDKKYYNDCVNQKTCELICGYTNKFEYSGSGDNAIYNYFSSYIYYTPNSNSYFIEFFGEQEDIDKAKYSYTFSSKYIAISNDVYDNLIKNKVCPKFSFIDTNFRKELCFSNDQNICYNKSNAGTKFKGESTLDYSYYSNNVMPNNNNNQNNSSEDNLNGGISQLSCNSLLGNPKNDEDPAYYLTVAFKVMRYVAIILLIVMSIIDFVGSVAAQDDDALKKAVNKMIKRAIMCVLIFILPTIIEYVLQFIDDISIKDCIDMSLGGNK